MNFLKLLTVFVAMSMLTGIKCNNRSAGKAVPHDGSHAAFLHTSHDQQWSRINANDSAIRAQLTSLCTKSEWLDSLMDSARVNGAHVTRQKSRRIWIEDPNPHPGDSTMYITRDPMEIQ